jgi:transcriptional regulator with XRE-family HTH domain
MPGTKTRRKWRFGQALQRMRERAGRTVEEAGAVLHKDASQVSKIENGHRLCAHAEMTTLAMYYRATEGELAEVETLWQDAKQDSTRIQGSSAFPPKFRAFLRSEADAATVSELQPNFIPGLLQTGDYSTYVRNAAHRIVNPSIGVERATAARLARQKRLEGPEPLKLHVVIDECVIRRVVGGPAIMAQQLRHLVAMGEQSHVTIQVIEEMAGAYGAMSSALTILGFDDPEDPDSVYLEHLVGGEWIDERGDIEKFKGVFTDASAQALPPAESVVLIWARVKELEGR